MPICCKLNYIFLVNTLQEFSKDNLPLTYHCLLVNEHDCTLPMPNRLTSFWNLVVRTSGLTCGK